MAYNVGAIFTNPLFIYPAGFLIILFVVWKLMHRGEKAKLISMAEIFQNQMKDILEQNKSAKMILMQKGNLVGITSNYGEYKIDKILVYFILYSPRWFLLIPKFWVDKIMIVSESCVKGITIRPVKYSRFNMTRKTPQFELEDHYFIDKWYNMRISFADKTVKKFVEHRISILENEVKGSITIAQALRLTSIDMSKPFSPATSPIATQQGQVTEAKK